ARRIEDARRVHGRIGVRRVARGAARRRDEQRDERDPHRYSRWCTTATSCSMPGPWQVAHAVWPLAAVLSAAWTAVYAASWQLAHADTSGAICVVDVCVQKAASQKLLLSLPGSSLQLISAIVDGASVAATGSA